MKKWYYKTVDLISTPSFWQAELDRLGNDGWELVQIIETVQAGVTVSRHAIFKKDGATSFSATVQTNQGVPNQWM